MIPRTEKHEIRCPVCGFECVHPVAVKVEPVNGDTVVYINRDGVFTTVSRLAERVRGVQITTTFMCEEMHQWDEVRSFHKGITTQTIQRGPDCADPWDAPELTPMTIWRD